MSKLNAKERNALPASEFAGPDRSYPVNDANHAANAKARASQQEKAGNISPAEEAKIDARANKVLGEKKPSLPHPTHPDYAKARDAALRKAAQRISDGISRDHDEDDDMVPSARRPKRPMNDPSSLRGTTDHEFR